jgi:hypothetical protein
LDKQLKHELFRDKIRLVTLYEKFPWAFLLVNSVEKKQNVENYKKLDKQLKHELFRDKVKLVTVYEKFPWALLLVNSVEKNKMSKITKSWINN